MKKLPAKLADLNPRQQQFCLEYLIDLNATQAAIRAGYSRNCASVTGLQLLRNHKIAAHIQKMKDARANRTAISGDQVLREISRLAFSDVRSFFGTDGKLLSIHELTDDQAAALSSVEVVKQNITTGDNATEFIHKIRLWDKLKALEMACKHLGLIKEKSPEVSDRPLSINLTIGQQVNVNDANEPRGTVHQAVAVS